MTEKNTHGIFWGDTKKAEIQEGKRIDETANRIFFYTKIDEESALNLNKILIEMSITHIHEKLTRQLEQADPIYLHINSPGGLLYDALAIVETIKRVQKSGVKVHTTIDGYAASAATLLSVVGNKRQMGKYSYMLIHQLSSDNVGKYDEIQDHMKNLDKLMNNIKEIYIKHCKFPEKELIDLLKHDLILDAGTCLKYELIDIIE